LIVIFMVNLFFFQVSYLLFFCYYNLVATGFQSKKKLKKFRRILTIEMWQLKFDHHLDNQFLFSSFMFLLFFATQIWSPRVWGGLKWYHGVHKDWDQNPDPPWSWSMWWPNSNLRKKWKKTKQNKTKFDLKKLTNVFF